MLASVTTGATSLDIGLILTTFGFGVRHGIDWDHIAALTDITSSQDTPRRSMRFATLYAVGHALVVFGLGVAAIVFAEQLPASVDAVMERFVGATLVLLGVYVAVSLLRHGRDFRMRSRWMLLFAGARRGFRWAARSRSKPVIEVVHDHAHDHEHGVDAGHHAAAAHAFVPVDAGLVTRDHGVTSGYGVSTGPDVTRRHGHRHQHRHVAEMPDDPFLAYSSRSAFGVGMIHGIGAETPTQVLVFLAAAGAGGKGVGLMLLGCFIVGLLSSNTLIALAGTFGFLGASRNFRLYVAVSVLTAGFSLVLGTLFLFGRGTVLPAFFGG
jgi:hypothetical protein